MSFSLLPTIILDSLTDVTPELLLKRNIRLLMMDFDNTIVPYTTSVPTEKMVSWFEMMRSSQVRIAVVSNSHNDRVQVFCNRYNIPCIVRAGKPGTRGIRECLEKFSVPAVEAALVGDQIYTDTLGGNLAGVSTILIRAIHNHNFWLKARHVLEMPFILAASGRRVR